MCAAMKSTADTSSGCSIQTCQISPVVTGTFGRALDVLDHRDQVGDRLLAAVDRFVADDDAVDVAVALGEFDHRADFALVALLVLVDPGADGDPQAEFLRRCRAPARRRRSTNRVRMARVSGASSSRSARICAACACRLRSRDGRCRRTGRRKRWPVGREFGSAQVVLRESPQAGLHARHEGDHGSDGAHNLKPNGAGFQSLEPVPWAQPKLVLRQCSIARHVAFFQVRISHGKSLTAGMAAIIFLQWINCAQRGVGSARSGGWRCLAAGASPGWA